MENLIPEKIRNIAIIAHVDHGKTTLVDSLLKQSHVFRENESQMQEERILDKNDLERERGITITAKNVAIKYKDFKINIIDTPGHSDFGGEVERTLNMADGCLLLIDAQEGPMPQTRFVLKIALEQKKKIILVVNKIDKPFANVEKVLKKTFDLFLELATHEAQLDFPIFYAIAKDGKVFSELPTGDLNTTTADVQTLLDGIIENIPSPDVDITLPLQMLVTSLDSDPHEGRFLIGKVSRGNISRNMPVVLLNADKSAASFKITKIYVSEGLGKREIETACGGDIVSITGIKDAKIGDTIADPSKPEALPPILTLEPPVRIKFEANTSPFLGKEGKFVTSRQLEERLVKEMETNISMRMEKTGSGGYYISGRGELHLSILIETMRREGYEFQVSNPETVFKIIDGKEFEPLEEVLIDTTNDYIGEVTTEMSRRKAELVDMVTEGDNGSVRVTYKALTKNLFGLRNDLVNRTRGNSVLNTFFLEYVPKQPVIAKARNGVIISSAAGTAMTYAIESIQERGTLFVLAGTQVYEGMIVGLNKFEQDMEVNITRERHKTGVRSAFVEIDTPLKPIIPLTLEFCLTFLEKDELLEVTPKNLRLRKRYLTQSQRDVAKRTTEF